MAAAARGCRFVLVSPLRDDLPAECGALEVAADPARHRHRADAGAGAHAGRRWGCTTGLPRPLLRRLGPSSRTTCWAAPTASPRTPTGRAASAACRRDIAALARSLHGRRVLVCVAMRCSAPTMASSRCGWAPCWPRRWARSACRAAATPTRWARWRTTASAERGAVAAAAAGPQRRQAFIPVARIADMLLDPGEPFDYNGRRTTYPTSAGLLGRRQPLPPPPGPEPAAPRLRRPTPSSCRRFGLDGHRAPCRHRAAGTT
jgi:biotin/methionine sulfoxide reductase